MRSHSEEAYEALIEEVLVEHGGYEAGDAAAYDADLALLPNDLLAFVEKTQPKVWAKQQKIHGDALRNTFISAFDKATKGRKSIIISTIHKFGFIADKVGELKDKTYAVIVDEAHSSQSGDMARNMKEILGGTSIAEKFEEEADDVDMPDQAVLRAALSRGPQSNMSFFALTATPKFKTLELFPRRQGLLRRRRACRILGRGEGQVPDRLR